MIDYLKRELKRSVNVGEWPAWHFAPYVAIWAIESIVQPGAIGWWAFSGDLPTDYISSADVNPPQHPRKAMCVIGNRWLETADAWSAGRDYPNIKMKDAETQRKLAPLLAARARLFLRFVDNDEYWPD